MPQAGRGALMRFRAILFDLDGTLVDSAPDLAGAANELLALHGRPALPYERLRRFVGSGARGMVGAAFGLTPADDGYPPLRDAFLDLYQRRLLQASRVFDEVPALLARIESSGCPWGVVTNKAVYLADPLLAGLALRQRAAVLVGGDSTPHRKPHPEPLRHALRQLGIDARDAAYVGDDARDVAAGRAAGLTTVAAGWGYLGEDLAIEHWGADHVAATPSGLLNWLNLP
ncbi:MAG: phosphoglycolate phosphatase [Proteobacteria bacterium]|nr:phosphoglycolate phosphatase [Pseudomonadota bacterium]